MFRKHRKAHVVMLLWRSQAAHLLSILVEVLQKENSEVLEWKPGANSVIGYKELFPSQRCSLEDTAIHLFENRMNRCWILPLPGSCDKSLISWHRARIGWGLKFWTRGHITNGSVWWKKQSGRSLQAVVIKLVIKVFICTMIQNISWSDYIDWDERHVPCGYWGPG